MDEPILGMVCLFPWNWAPHGWVKCDGRELPVAQNPALYSLLGNEFGGKPSVTFCIPKLNPIKAATGGDLDYYIAIQGLYPTRE